MVPLAECTVSVVDLGVHDRSWVRSRLEQRESSSLLCSSDPSREACLRLSLSTRERVRLLDARHVGPTRPTEATSRQGPRDLGPKLVCTRDDSEPLPVPQVKDCP